MIELRGLSIPLSGETRLPPDKSISHRALIHSMLAPGESILFNLPDSADVQSTLKCIQQCGAKASEENGVLRVTGVGFRGITGLGIKLDAGNSGTTARLMSGVMAMQPVPTTIYGDTSLSRRPMNRIILPLRQMGCNISGTDNGTLPISIEPADKFHPLTRYELPVASAQLKASLLLAAMHLEDESLIIESVGTRDHTERMLGIEKEIRDGKEYLRVSRKDYPVATEYHIPGDPSSAAFLIAAAVIRNGSHIAIHDVLLNPRRLAFIEILRDWGANIETIPVGESNNESFGTMIIRSSELVPKPIASEMVASIIDEIPMLAIMAAFGDGAFCIRNASELRMKETDRISATAHNLRALGLEIDEFPDGFAFSCSGTRVKQAVFQSFGDHRIAMSCGVAAMNLENGALIDSLESVKISFPDFLKTMQSLTEYKWLK